MSQPHPCDGTSHDLCFADRECVRTLVEGLLGDVAALQAEIVSVRSAMTSAAVLERATGVVMAANAADAARASTILRTWAEEFGVDVHVVAQTVLRESWVVAERDEGDLGPALVGPRHLTCVPDDRSAQGS